RAVRERERAVLQAQGLAEEAVRGLQQGRHELHRQVVRLGGEGVEAGGEVETEADAAVDGDRDMVRRSERADLLEARKAAAAAEVGLEDVGGARGEQVAELP